MSKDKLSGVYLFNKISLKHSDLSELYLEFHDPVSILMLRNESFNILYQ